MKKLATEAFWEMLSTPGYYAALVGFLFIRCAHNFSWAGLFSDFALVTGTFYLLVLAVFITLRSL